MKGVLLVNLGSPDSTKISDVKKYLDEFLMDEHVLDMPYWKRFLIVKGVILNTRPKKTAKAYQKIWSNKEAPLIEISKNFTNKLSAQLKIPITLAMRYGSMSIEKGLQELNNQKVDEVLVIPLYPQFAMSSYETVQKKVEEIKDRCYRDIQLDFFPVFYKDSAYIDTMVKSIQKGLSDFDYNHVLFSYHGLPERHILKADPTKTHCKLDGSCCEKPSIAHDTCYRHQCFETTRLLVDKLNLDSSKYSISFQSRLLKDPWLKPYTDKVLVEFPKQNKKKLAVIAPAFVTDCLETLEEIAIAGKKTFLDAGGEEFKYIPCLNEDKNWVNVVKNWIENWHKTA